jgi:hypothetical protein
MAAEHELKAGNDLEPLLPELDPRTELVMSSVKRILERLCQQRFFGVVELKFEAGSIVLFRKTETIKPEHCRDNRGETRGRED